MNFSGLSQKIVAAQAPKENMVSGFWQMVLDNNVRVIVMITKLVEDSKVKAHAYWPQQKNASLELENDIKVVLKDENTEKVSIFTLAFGEDADLDMLQKISEQNNGFTKHVSTSEDSSIYEEIEKFYLS